MVLSYSDAFAACTQVAPNPNPPGSSLYLPYYNYQTGEVYDYCNNSTLSNDGSIIFDGKFTNNGVLNNDGGIGLNLSSYNYGTINNGSDGGFSSHWFQSFTSYGTINNAGRLSASLFNYGVLNNSGSFGSSDAFANHGVVNNSGVFYLSYIFGSQNANAGTINNLAGGKLNISDSNFSGTVNNAGNLRLHWAIGDAAINQTDGMTTFYGVASANSIQVNGGAFSGSGDFYGRVVLNGGTLTAGYQYPNTSGIGTMQLHDPLTFNSGTLFTEIGVEGSDLITLNGPSSFLMGTLSFSFIDGFVPLEGGQWLFLTSALGITGLDSFSLLVSGLGTNYDYWVSGNGNQYYLNVAAVPEPETYAMLLAGLVILGAVARRRKQLA